MPLDVEQEFDPRAYLLAADNYEGVLVSHGYKFSGRVGQLDRPEKERDPVYSKEFGDCRPDIILERGSSGRVIARMIMSYFGSHFTKHATSPPMLNRLLAELETAIKKRNMDYLIAFDRKWDREDDELEEAFEQPGPDMPGDEQPAEEPFDPREYFLAMDTKGEQRLKFVTKKLEHHDSRYYLKYTSKGTYSDFDEQANYEYFKANYSFLNYESEVIGFDPYAIEHPDDPEDKKSFETYLGEIDDDDWDGQASGQGF